MSRVPTPSPVSKGSSSMVTTTVASPCRARRHPGGASVAGFVAVLPALAGDRVRTVRRRKGFQRDGQHRAVEMGALEPAMTHAVAVVEDRQRRLPSCRGFFRLEPAEELCVGGFGVDDVQEVAGQQLQPLGVMASRLLEQVRLGTSTIGDGDESRERVDRGGDHIRLSNIDAPVRECRARGCEVEAGVRADVGARDRSARRDVEPRREPGPPVCGPVRRDGGMREPGSGRGSAAERCHLHVGTRSMCKHRQAQCVEAANGAAQLDRRLRSLRRVQVHDVDAAGSELVEDLVHPPGEPVHPTAPIPEGRGARRLISPVD